MNDLLLHELSARRVHWRYDDPSGVAESGSRIDAKPVRAAHDVRVRVGRRQFLRAI
ncbi:MAG TPA: hypothetical protein VFJ77_05295 [Gaiellaceae bacterium]|nr:hypothetical protein [Gaiellaceae bacterium]